MRYRYRTDEELKDSGVEWIGKIPKDYKLEPLKKYFMFEKGRNAGIYTAEYVGKNEGKYPVYSGQTENEGIMGLIDSYEYDLKQCLFTTTVGAKVMTVLYLTGKFTLSQNCLIMINNMNNVCTKYAYYYLQELFRYEKSLIPLYMQPSLRIEDLKRYKILIQNLREQEKIANFLDKKTSQFDSIISKKEKLIEKLEEAKKSLISEVVTGKVKVVKSDEGYELVKRKSDEMKDSGVEWLGYIPKDWEVKRLRFLGKLQNGISKNSEEFGFGYPFVSYSNVYRNIELPQKIEGLINSTKEERKIYSVREGDVLFTRTSETINEIGLASTCMDTIENSTFAGFLIRFRPSYKRLYKGFSKYYFRCDLNRKYFVKEMNLVTRASLSQNLLNNLAVTLPDYKEQVEIYNALELKIGAINLSIDNLKYQIDKLKEAKQSLISEAVTGKIEILD